jgi:hypothetical protein
LVTIEKIKAMHVANNSSLITNEKIGYSEPLEPHITTSKLHNHGMIIFCGELNLSFI